MRRLVINTLAVISLCWSATPSYAARSQSELELIAAKLAADLSGACPQSSYGDTKAFQACAASLTQAADLPFAPEVLWGGDQPSLRIKKRKLTTFNSRVFRTMYLPLMSFTGRFSVDRDEKEKLDVIKLEAYFRNELPAGEYPYPFWHSADKWNAYETMNLVRLYLDDKGRIVVITRSADGTDKNRGEYARIRPPAFVKDQWTWVDEAGKQQPEVTLFSARFQAANPVMPALDKSYRAFATEMRQASCVECHNPSNPQGMEKLTLLQTPAHAAGEIDEVIKAVKEGSMPQDDIGLRKDIDPKLRASILRSAEAFRDQLAAADAWESNRVLMAASPAPVPVVRDPADTADARQRLRDPKATAAATPRDVKQRTQ